MALRRFFLFCTVALAAFGAPAQSTFAQRSSGWRVYKSFDGLPRHPCTSVTVGLNGNVFTTHARNPLIGVLDGYGIETIPGTGYDPARVASTPSGQLWAMTSDGLHERRDNSWVLVPELRIVAEARNPGSLLAFVPARQGCVLVALKNAIVEVVRENSGEWRTSDICAADRMGIGEFTGMAAAWDGGVWIVGTRGIARAPGPIRNLNSATLWEEFPLPATPAIRNLREPRGDDAGGLTLVADFAENPRTCAARFDGRRWYFFADAGDRLLCAWQGPDGMEAITREALLSWKDGAFVENRDLPAREYFDAAPGPGHTLWLATADGVYRFAPSPWRFPASLTQMNSSVFAMTGDAAGGLWLVANNKLHVLRNGIHHEFALPAGTRASHGTAMAGLKSGALLLALGSDLYEFVPESGAWTPVFASGPSPAKILGVMKDGTVCIRRAGPGPGAKTRWEVCDGAGVRRFPHEEPSIDATGDVAVLFAARNGDLWAGGERAVALWRGNEWRVFASTDKTTPEAVDSFTELPDGKIWCAAQDRIWEFDGRGWSLIGTGFDRITGLKCTRDGSVWVSSDNGVHRFHQKAWLMNGVEEGLGSGAVHGLCEDAQGRLWAATARGLSFFASAADPDPPKTSIHTRASDAPGIVEGGTLNLQFEGRDKWKLTPPDRLLYSYRVDQHDWSAFQESRTAAFPDLAAGKHYFQVRAMDRSGNLETVPAQFEFLVSLPWYRETRLLWISSGGFVIAMFFAGLAFNRHRQLLRSYAAVEEKVAERTRQLEAANRELLHSQKMNALGTLAAGIAHDFNNILSIIKGSTQIIEDNLNDGPKVRTRLDRIKTMVEQGSGIVKAMLGFSRDSDGQPTRCSPNEVVEDTVRLLGDRFLREVEVRFEPVRDLPEISASKDFVQQVLLNFIFNAAESMPRKKQVVLAIERFKQLPPGMALVPATAAEYVAISVQDSGCGIPPENLSRIFEPFFTTKAFSARRGTGLGLSMAYELAKKMDAGLAVESVLNEGSRFSLVLPVRDGADKENNPIPALKETL